MQRLHEDVPRLLAKEWKQLYPVSSPEPRLLGLSDESVRSLRRHTTALLVLTSYLTVS